MTKPFFQGKLKPAFKKKWVKALRSGKYKQGQGALFTSSDCHYDENDSLVIRDGGSYCCLGVALKESLKIPPEALFERPFPIHGEIENWWEQEPSTARDKSFDPDNARTNPYIKYKNRFYNLSELNDTKMLSFVEIADLIEAQL